MTRGTARLRASARHLALALLVLLGSPAAASAHAVLLSASPAADSVVIKCPDHIELSFNEPVEVLGLRIIDGAGEDRSPQTALDVRDGQVVWSLQGPLADGRYLVSWRVASLDGHVIGGTFTFGIGAAGVAKSPAIETSEESHWPFLALHAVARLFLLFAIGTALFRLLLSPQALALWLRKATRFFAIGGILALILFIGAEGAMRAGLPIAGEFSLESIRAAFGASNFALRGLAAAGLVLLAAGGRRLVQSLGIACAIAAMADSGHVLALLPGGVGHGLMMLHGLAAGMWIGAIAPLHRALTRDAGGATVELFRRFQTYGALAMGATLASGLVLAYLLLPRLMDLWQSDYGLRLCAKLVAVALMLLIAANNRLWLTRRALAGQQRVRDMLRTILGLDLVAAILATVLAVGLSLGPPPAETLELAVASESYGATLSFEPGRIGDNDLTIVLTPKSGAPTDPKEVEVRFAVPGIEPIVRKATQIGAGRYGVHDLPLWIAGRWQVQLGLLIDDFTKLQLSTQMTIQR